MVADRALVARRAVAAPARPQLGLRHRRRAHRADCARRGEREAQLRAAGRSAAAGSRRAAAARASRSSTSSVAAHVGAAEAELAGRAQRVGERGGRAQVERGRRPPFVGGSSVPSQNVSRNGRSGTAALELAPQRLGGAHSGHGYVLTALRAWRSGLMRTTSQASPVRSSAQITHAEMSSCQPRRPWRVRRRERVVVVVPGLAERERREPEQVARLVAGLEVPAAEEVAQRVDAVGHVVDDEHAHEAAPQQAGRAPVASEPPIE